MTSYVKALYLCIPPQKFQNMADLRGEMSIFWNPIFDLIRWIQFSDKKDLIFIDCCDKLLSNSSWKTLLSSPKAHLTFFKTRLITFYLKIN